MAAAQRRLRAALLVLLAAAASAQLCLPGVLDTPIPAGCPNSTLAGPKPASVTCQNQPGNANGGMLFDLTNVDSQQRTLYLTGFSFLVPSAYSSGATSFPLVMLYRRRNAAACLPDAYCTGSVRDNSISTQGVYMAGGGSSVQAPGAPACNLSDPSWLPLLAGAMRGSGSVVRVPGTVRIPLAPGETIGIW